MRQLREGLDDTANGITGEIIPPSPPDSRLVENQQKHYRRRWHSSTIVETGIGAIANTRLLRLASCRALRSWNQEK